MIAGVRYARDPLSVRYEGAAGRLLGEAYARPGTWIYRGVGAPAGESWDDSKDAGGLRVWERAYQRALWRVHGQRNEVWSLQVTWGPDTPRGRLLGIRVTDKAVGRRAARRLPAHKRYTENPRLASGGLGSSQARFSP